MSWLGGLASRAGHIAWELLDGLNPLTATGCAPKDAPPEGPTVTIADPFAAGNKVNASTATPVPNLYPLGITSIKIPSRTDPATGVCTVSANFKSSDLNGTPTFVSFYNVPTNADAGVPPIPGGVSPFIVRSNPGDPANFIDPQFTYDGTPGDGANLEPVAAGQLGVQIDPDGSTHILGAPVGLPPQTITNPELYNGHYQLVVEGVGFEENSNNTAVAAETKPVEIVFDVNCSNKP
jgi:hypothetical protein